MDFTAFWPIAVLVILSVSILLYFDSRKLKKKLGRIRCSRCGHVGKPRMVWAPFRGVAPVCKECGSGDWRKE